MEPIPVVETSYSETASLSAFMLKVYSWMTLGLGLTAIVSLFIEVALPGLRWVLVENPFIFYFLLIAELAIVWGLTALINRIPFILSLLIFLGYAALNGVTFSIIFLVYNLGSIAMTFFVTAGMFAGTSLLGFITKIDLSRFGGILMMALIGLILASVANLFFASEKLDWIISYAGVFIFVGLTAYDTQKIKNMGMSADSSSEEGNKYSITGALTLYLDFINLFLFLLRILGRRR